jgi:hypothetical protein
VTQALEFFKEVEKHTFTMIHYWVALKDYPKWQKSFSQWQKYSGKKRDNDSMVIHLEEDGGPSKSSAKRK